MSSADGHRLKPRKYFNEDEEEEAAYINQYLNSKKIDRDANSVVSQSSAANGRGTKTMKEMIAEA